MFAVHLKIEIMGTAFMNYLIESSVCLLFFLAFYRLALSNLTHFNWMRAYLLSSLMLSLFLPLVKIPDSWFYSIVGKDLLDKQLYPINLNPLTIFTPNTFEQAMQSIPSAKWPNVLIFIILIFYGLGVLYKTVRLIKSLLQIRESIHTNDKRKEENYWIITTNSKLAAFSFLNFIFISKNYRNHTLLELEQIKLHEKYHVNQRHTIDLLFVELYSILFWFNPLVYFAKSKLQEVHEFIADRKVAGNGETKRSYAQLLYDLAIDSKPTFLLTGFTSKQIKNRIEMISKKRSMSAGKLLFLAFIPVTAILLLSFSYLDNSPATIQNDSLNIGINSMINSQLKIGKITWVNNSIISTEGLNKILGLKTGDEYVKKSFEKRIWSDMDGISTYYLDKGYLFSKMDIQENPVNGGTIDLTITIYKGIQGKIGKVSVKGNKNVPTEEILTKITLKHGDLFSKTRIIESVRALSNMGKFDNERIMPNITPKPREAGNDFGIVDIEFKVIEI
ncbi:MAG: POTRA domain-containing protein [Mariniphaga sp.]